MGALYAIEDGMFVHQTALTQRILNMCLPIKLIKQWIARRGVAAALVRELVGDLRAADRHDIAMLAVVNCVIFSEINGESAACL